MLEKISHTSQRTVDFILNKVEMPITKKIYSSTGDSTLYKVILISSMILPLIALLELTLRNMLYLPLKNLLMTLTRKNPVVLPFYKREVVKIGTIGILSSLVTYITYASFMPTPDQCPDSFTYQLKIFEPKILGGIIAIGILFFGGASFLYYHLGYDTSYKERRLFYQDIKKLKQELNLPNS